jgi:hypothetical protein
MKAGHLNILPTLEGAREWWGLLRIRKMFSTEL